MDTSALKRRYDNKIPADVQHHIDKFTELANKEGILSVKLLSNFGKDVEMSLKHDTPVYRGLIVQLSNSYKLSQQDRLWLHPELCKGRSMYAGGSKQTSPVDLSDFNSSAGFYSTHIIDEIGGYDSKQYVIIDSGLDKEADVLTSSWILSKSSIKQAYDEVVKSKLAQKSLEKRDQLAMTYGTNKRELNSNYNMLYTDSKSYFFYNHAIKPQNGQAILAVSPLMGCAAVKNIEENHIESDLLSSSQYVNVNALQEEQRRRAMVDCKWKGKQIVNTYTMRKPIDNFKKWLEDKQATMYRMETGYFSANPIHSKLPSDIVLFLTPEKHLIPVETSCHQHIRDGVIDVPANAENIQRLMDKHWKTLISKKYIKGDSLLLPRNMIEESLV
jgi:hypothetical protein